jgi:arylsulfatase A-like enzyme
LPGLDRALSRLVLDLEERGMLDDTLVLCLTEHGRTPKLHDKGANGVGREHWSQVYSSALAGAGIRGGSVIGSSDREGAFVKDNPISPKDILCTLYHLLGIDHHTTVPDRFGRPYPLVSSGRVVEEMLG